MTYRYIESSEIQSGAPGTVQLFTALARNPGEMAGGADGSPVVQAGWHPYDMAEYGDGADGQIYNAASSATITTPDFADGYEYRLVFQGLSATISTLRVRAYLETSATYTGYAAIHDGGSGGIWGTWDIIRPRDTSNAFTILQNTARPSPISNGISADNAALRLIITALPSQKITNLQFNVSSGTFTGGQIYMHRRLAL